MQPSALIEARKRLGLSRAALAKAIGMSTISVTRMELGTQPIKLVVKLAVEALEGRAGRSSAVQGQ
jgi:transcriptional regulator with XRE-family HTH domain